MSNPKKHVLTRTIALYPGAFRPPHAAHMHAVQHLLGRADIDEVVIIISNRARHIPSTDQALEVDIAAQIWAIYLQGLTNVRVEIATTTAIQHALAYFNHQQTGDTLLFCMGEADLQAGDPRFSRIQALAKKTQIKAKIIAAPTGTFTLRSTQLRKTLATGEKNKATFLQGLPQTLSVTKQQQVWEICQQNKRSMTAITQQRIQTLLEKDDSVFKPRHITRGQNQQDPLFFVETLCRQSLVIKYAGYSTSEQSVNQRGRAKSRERVSTERMALKWLNTTMRPNTPANVQFPRILNWQKKDKMLIMSHPSQASQSGIKNSQTLEQHLKRGKITLAVAKKLGHFIANCHHAPAPKEAFWDSETADQQHWLMRLEQHFSSIKTNASLSKQLHQLHLNSIQASKKQFVHLDLQPKNILLSPHYGNNHIAVVDFEQASSYGDAAFDIGLLLGHYLFYAYWQRGAAFMWEIHRSILTYYALPKKLAMDSAFIQRVNAFAVGAVLLLLMGYQGDAVKMRELEGLVERLLGDFS